MAQSLTAIHTRIKIYTTPDGVSPAYFEENTVRELPLELLEIDEEAILFNQGKKNTPFHINFNTNQKMIIDYPTDEIVVLTERVFPFDGSGIYLTIEEDDAKFYKLISQENQFMGNLNNEIIKPNHNAYIFASVDLIDAQNNFKIRPFILPTIGNTNFRFTELETNKVPINRIYGISEQHEKQDIRFKNERTDQFPIPFILAPISAEHDVKMWEVLSDPEKTMEIGRIKKLIKLQAQGKNNLSHLDAILLPPVARRTLKQVVQISIAADSAFQGIGSNGKISGIEVARITKLSADIVVNFLIQNTILKNDPNLRDSNEWILFSQWMFAASHAISLPEWMLPSGKTEQNKVVLPFYIDILIDSSAQYDADGNIPDDKIIFKVKSLYFDIDTTDIDNPKFTLKDKLYKFINSMYAFRTPDPYIFSELPKEIKAKNESLSVNRRIFDANSQVEKYLFWILGDQDAIGKLLTKTTYSDVEISEKQVYYDWYQNQRPYVYQWIKSVPGPWGNNLAPWVTITNKDDERFIKIMEHVQVPYGYQAVSMQVKQSNQFYTYHSRGNPSDTRKYYRLEAIVVFNNQPSLPDLDVIVENPVLDASRFLEKIQQISGTGVSKYDITQDNYVPYIYIKAWLLNHYKVTISYEDANGDTQTIERQSSWQQKYDNSITEFKLAVNQKIDI